MFDPNRPRAYEVVALNADGTREVLEILGVTLKTVDREGPAIFEITVAGKRSQSDAKGNL